MQHLAVSARYTLIILCMGLFLSGYFLLGGGVKGNQQKTAILGAPPHLESYHLCLKILAVLG